MTASFGSYVSLPFSVQEGIEAAVLAHGILTVSYRSYAAAQQDVTCHAVCLRTRRCHENMAVQVRCNVAAALVRITGTKACDVARKRIVLLLQAAGHQASAAITPK